jgi:uncharacterized membrane protein YgaE (UPF0421/DUF939 family)
MAYPPVLADLTWRAGLTRALARSAVLVAAVVAILVLYGLLGLPSGGWAVIAAALVFNAHADASLRQAMTLVIANVVGGAVSLLALYLCGSTIASIVVAMLMVAAICHLARLDDGLRAAYVCVAIVLAIDQSAGMSSPIERIASVAFGSLAGVAVSLLVQRIEGWWAARTA